MFKPSTRNQILTYIPVFTLYILNGLANGWISPACLYFKSANSTISLSNVEISWLAAIHEGIATIIAIPAGILSETIGKRLTLLLCGIFFTFGFSIISLGNYFLPLFIGKCFHGLAIGIINAITYIYVGEIASAKIRGRFFTLLYSAYFIGLLIQYILMWITSYFTSNIFCVFFSLIYFVFFYWLTESPNYLLNKNKENEATRVFRWLRVGKNEAEINEEFSALKEYLESQKLMSNRKINLIKNRENLKSLFIVSFITILASFTGNNAVISFSSTTFKSLLETNKFIVYFGIVQLSSSFCSSSLNDKVGRRKLLISSSIASCIFHAATGFLYFNDYSYKWLVFFTITGYTISYSCFMGPSMSSIRGELFPQNIKAVAASVCAMTMTTSSFIVIFIFQSVSNNFGTFVNFWFYSIISLILAIFAYKVLPETKNKTLTEIQKSLMKREKTGEIN